ncbi:MAG: hypothetical protein IKJ43_00805 [Bacilli bacterium]|nr:hypothetical protein [Bacilli bacterium]
MMQNKEYMTVEELKEAQMYEYFNSLSSEELEEVIEEIKNDDNLKEDSEYIIDLNNVMKRLEDERLREKFYWELYFLVDKDDNLTILGEYYTLIYTHHYLKALKLFLSFSDTLRDKNKVFFKNEKAMEYLEHFRNFVKKENTKVKKIK